MGAGTLARAQQFSVDVGLDGTPYVCTLGVQEELPMPTSRSSTDRTERVSMRASRSQKAVIERAAAAVDKNMTDFVLEAAAAQADDRASQAKKKSQQPTNQWVFPPAD